MKNFMLSLFCIFSIGLITNVLALGTEGIYNGQLGDRIEHKYLAAIMTKKNCGDKPKLIGSGAVVLKRYVLSAAHYFVDLTSGGRYKLKPKTFYVNLGTSNLNSDFGELIIAETFYLFGYNSTTGQNDLILIKIAHYNTGGVLKWESIHLATEDIPELTTLEGKVSSHGMHKTKNDMDRRLRFATANIVDKRKCDNILDENSSQICIQMYKDDSNGRRGLCKYDGGAPFVVSFEGRNYLTGIASKPKVNCDDTHRGAVYTDVSRFERKIVSTAKEDPIEASQILLNNGPSTFSCTIQ